MARSRTTSGEAARRRKGAPTSPVLTREMIVEATVAQIDEAGLDNFSLRALAARLGVFPTAIYWHVPGRNELLSQAVAAVMSDVLPKRRRGGWHDYLKDVCRRFRNAIRQHPNFAPLIGTQLLSNVGVNLRFVDRILAALSESGLEGERLVGAYNTVIAALVGFTTQEFAPVPQEETLEWQEHIRDRLTTIDNKLYPVLAENVSKMANRAFILRWQNGIEAPLNASFEIFLDALIGGIEQLKA